MNYNIVLWKVVIVVVVMVVVMVVVAEDNNVLSRALINISLCFSLYQKTQAAFLYYEIMLTARLSRNRQSHPKVCSKSASGYPAASIPAPSQYLPTSL